MTIPFFTMATERNLFFLTTFSSATNWKKVSGGKKKGCVQWLWDKQNSHMGSVSSLAKTVSIIYVCLAPAYACGEKRKKNLLISPQEPTYVIMSSLRLSNYLLYVQPAQ